VCVCVCVCARAYTCIICMYICIYIYTYLHICIYIIYISAAHQSVASRRRATREAEELADPPPLLFSCSRELLLLPSSRSRRPRRWPYPTTRPCSHLVLYLCFCALQSALASLCIFLSLALAPTATASFTFVVSLYLDLYLYSEFELLLMCVSPCFSRIACSS